MSSKANQSDLRRVVMAWAGSLVTANLIGVLVAQAAESVSARQDEDPPTSAAPAASDDTRQDAASKAAALQYVFAEQDQAIADSLKPHLGQGRERIETFFGKPFPQSFVVEIHPDRKAFDAYFDQRWHLPKTELWMVASGVADRLTILSPRVWKSEAAEHDPGDEKHLHELIVHEMVHVFQGQHNPHPDFDGLDELGWLVEGLAVYVSGQLEGSHRLSAHQAIEAGKTPAALSEAWSGRYRYGVAGSMAEFIDLRYGRQTLIDLLPMTTNDQALKRLETTEADFLTAWKAHVLAAR